MTIPNSTKEEKVARWVQVCLESNCGWVFHSKDSHQMLIWMQHHLEESGHIDSVVTIVEYEPPHRVCKCREKAMEAVLDSGITPPSS